MEATLTQHPVGQGGMMSGLLTNRGERFHWVYDCGSNQIDALKREIASVVRHGNVDVLFLSHLDSDHVNGIDYLLAQTTVNEVVLPYLSDLDCLLAVAHDVTNGAISGGFVTFLSDTVGWLSARGVTRVTFIYPDTDDNDEDIRRPKFPEGSEISGEYSLLPKWFGGKQRFSKSTRRLNSETERVNVQHLATDAFLTVLSGNAVLTWLLAPYAHRPSDKQLAKFKSAIVRTTKIRNLSKLAELIDDKSFREALKSCYELLWSDHNLVSMALYAGPWMQSKCYSCCISAPPDGRRFVYASSAVGWLGTGDMHLNIKVRREKFLTHYRPLLNQVSVFGVPHHGSHRNFDRTVLTEMPNLSQCVAAAGPNGYGHPHAKVVECVESAGYRFTRVADSGAALRCRLQT